MNGSGGSWSANHPAPIGSMIRRSSNAKSRGNKRSIESPSVCACSALLRGGSIMPKESKNVGEEYKRLGKESFDAATRSFGEMNKGFQALAAEMTDYSKRTFDDVFRAWEQLLSAKSVEQMIEIQSQYAKKAYDTHTSEMSKLGEMYVAMARGATKSVEQATTGSAETAE